LLRNLPFWGIRLIFLGLLLNLTAMFANGGLMPVERSAVEAVGRHQVGDLQIGAHIPGSKNVLLNPQDVRLRELSDILVVPIPRPFTRAVSVGDLFVLAGVVITFGEVVRRSEAWKREPS
jgi:catalase (peroxidase I)